MLQNAYFIAKIGADTAENEQHFAEFMPKTGDPPPPKTGAARPAGCTAGCAARASSDQRGRLHGRHERGSRLLLLGSGSHGEMRGSLPRGVDKSQSLWGSNARSPD